MMSNKDGVCKFYLNGSCRHGLQCKFSHEGVVENTTSQSADPPKTTPKAKGKAGNNKSNRSTKPNKTTTATTTAGTGGSLIPPPVDVTSQEHIPASKPPAWGPGAKIPASIIAPTAGRPDSGTFAEKMGKGKQTPTRTSSAPPSQQEQQAPINVPFKTTLQYGSTSSPQAVPEEDNCQGDTMTSTKKQNNNDDLKLEEEKKSNEQSSQNKNQTAAPRSWASMAAGTQPKVEQSNQNKQKEETISNNSTATTTPQEKQDPSDAVKALLSLLPQQANINDNVNEKSTNNGKKDAEFKDNNHIDIPSVDMVEQRDLEAQKFKAQKAEEEGVQNIVHGGEEGGGGGAEVISSSKNDALKTADGNNENENNTLGPAAQQNTSSHQNRAFVRNNSTGSGNGGKGNRSRSVACHFWERGSCRNGDACPYVHGPVPETSKDGEEGGGTNSTGTSNQTTSTNTNANSNTNTGGGGGKGNRTNGKGNNRGGGKGGKGKGGNNNHHHRNHQVVSNDQGYVDNLQTSDGYDPRHYGGGGYNNFNMSKQPNNYAYAQQQQQMAYAQMMQQGGQWPGGPGGLQSVAPLSPGGGNVVPNQHQAQHAQIMAQQHAQMMYAQQQQYINQQQQMGNMNPSQANVLGNLAPSMNTSSMHVTPSPTSSSTSSSASSMHPPIPPVLNSNTSVSSVNSQDSMENRGGRHHSSSIPPPLYVPEYDNSVVFSVDVECVATGPQHHDRAIAQIGMVDCFGRMRLNILVKPDKPVVSYLTPLTGITKEKLEMYGQSEEVALDMLRQALPPNSILVGQNIRKDIDWLHLEQDKDYAACIDLADLFRVWNVEKGSYTYYSLEHISHCWLNVPHSGPGGHDAVVDAFHSMSLFNSYRTVQHTPALQELQMKTATTQVQPSFAKANPTFEGCCMGNRKTCTCGAPFYG